MKLIMTSGSKDMPTTAGPNRAREVGLHTSKRQRFSEGNSQNLVLSLALDDNTAAQTEPPLQNLSAHDMSRFNNGALVRSFNIWEIAPIRIVEDLSAFVQMEKESGHVLRVSPQDYPVFVVC